MADIGFCAAKKTRFDGVRRHCVARPRAGRFPLPAQVWLCGASHHDSKAFIGQQPELSATELFGELAYLTPQIISHLKEQQSRLIAPQKKPKGKELRTEEEKYYNRLVRALRRPIESLFNWIEEKTGIQRASKLGSTNALMIHCWGKAGSGFLPARFQLLIRIDLNTILTAVHSMFVMLPSRLTVVPCSRNRADSAVPVNANEGIQAGAKVAGRDTIRGP